MHHLEEHQEYNYPEEWENLASYYLPDLDSVSTDSMVYQDGDDELVSLPNIEQHSDTHINENAPGDLELVLLQLDGQVIGITGTKKNVLVTLNWHWPELIAVC